MLFLHNFERFNNLHSYHGRVGGNQLPPISRLLPRMTGRNMRPHFIYFPNWPPLRLRWAHYFRMRDHGSSLFSAVKNLHCSEVHVVVAKESDVTERMIHTGGEQIQGNETRNFRDRGRESAKKGVGKLNSTSSLHLDKDPRWAQKVRDVRLYSCWFSARSADVSDWGTARLRGSGLLAPRHHMATVACSMPASVYSFTSFSFWKWFISAGFAYSSCQAAHSMWCAVWTETLPGFTWSYYGKVLGRRRCPVLSPLLHNRRTMLWMSAASSPHHASSTSKRMFCLPFNKVTSSMSLSAGTASASMSAENFNSPEAVFTHPTACTATSFARGFECACWQTDPRETSKDSRNGGSGSRSNHHC